MVDHSQFGSRSGKRSGERRKKKRVWLGALLVVIFGSACLLIAWRIAQTPDDATAAITSGVAEDGSFVDAPSSAPQSDDETAVKNIVDFRMFDLESGWYREADGTIMVTGDGGATWLKAEADWREPIDIEAEAGTEDERFGQAAKQAIEAAYSTFDPDKPVVFRGLEIEVRRIQPVGGAIGWALAAEGSGLSAPLLVTVDGGATWQDETTADVRAAIAEEQARRERRAEEAALYESPQMAQQAMKPGAHWTLLPGKTYPGDVVLVRSNESGTLEWQGKTYMLQPYKAGFFTYLPIPRKVKPGSYAIGDATLIVGEKTFKTQQLTVSKEMESMRENTERIQADQKKIDAARASSASTFLFDSAFLIPLEGRLTTPYGYTRYVNGKLSSSHNAIDLAAPEGTPLKATNDGVVALADELYLTGNAVYIDHGMGLFSQYAHLSELHVKTGDTVKKGDIIGLVGTTGFSTGPHLHFTFWAHNIQANPNLFFDTTPFLWLKETE